MNLNRQLKIFTFFISMLFLAPSAHAELQDALDSMFTSNSTTPGSFSNQTRGGLVGGGGSIRMPIRNINLVAFDPPRISAGCGGIDLFGGAFSFINADQLVALFRQIAANAVGVAFKAAINAINPQLAGLMEEFQSKIAALNNMMKNTCAVAQTVMDKSGASDAIRSFVGQSTSSITEAIGGGVSDVLAGVNSILPEPNKVTRDSQNRGDPEMGNITWKALNASKASQLFGDPSSSADTNSSNEVMMSLLGTVIVGPASSTDSENPDGSVQVDNGRFWKPTIHLSELRDGNMDGDRPVVILRCTDGYDEKQCRSLSMSNLNFGGVSGLVNTQLFGDSSGKTTTTDSIVGKLLNCSGTGCSFSNAQQNFINTVSAPVLGLIKKVQSQPSAAEVVARQLTPVIVDEITIMYAEAALNAVGKSFSGTKYTMDANIRQSETDLRQEITALRNTTADRMNTLNATFQYAEQIIKNNPAINGLQVDRRN